MQPPSSVSVSEAFNRVLIAVNPQQADLEYATGREHNIKERLDQATIPESSKMFQTLRVMGSFKRGTAVHPLKDIDMLAGLGPHIGTLDGNAVLEAVLKQLMTLFPDATVRRQTHSIGLHWPERPTISFDVVPVRTSQVGNTYLIATSGVQSWTQTNPHAAEDRLKQANAIFPQLIPLIRVLKHWNMQQQLRRAPDGDLKKPFKSFHLEVMCYQAFKAKPVGNDRQTFRDLLHYLRFAVLKPVETPGVSGQFIDAYLDGGGHPFSRQELSSLLQRSADWATNATIAEDKREHSAAHKYWRMVLGNVYQEKVAAQ